MLGVLPNSKEIKDIDPLLYLWMFFSWQKDLQEKAEFAENYAMLTGAFSNIEMYRKIKGTGGTSFKSTNFDELSESIKNTPIIRHPKRKRRMKNG